MPDSTTLQSQYAAQIQSDLDSNVAEREHIAAQIGALQEQLTTLENNHALLASMQHAVGGPAAPAPRKAAAPAKSAAGKKTAAASAPRIPQARAAQKSAGRAGKKQTGPAAKPSKAVKSTKAGKASSGAPTTLRDLVAAHLAQSGEPRSAAEITTGLTEAHPDRTIAGTVVRNTLENLVAKGEAQRTRQNRSVFYTAPDAKAAAPAAASADGDVKKEADAVTPAASN
ncbi:hypothetical protein [Streptomyces sp. NBC_00083]|uniref:hypothetical protein n=1 Tax=Streptomyces sp. NBC_00083 TaxID=2975647 RepID=UPI00225AE3F1|nr:hypothetical protein [Streptomyces sp. NBC_00083]MCX5384067.1 hypothetical protein [Streptomyces sp. NBC_00083]